MKIELIGPVGSEIVRTEISVGGISRGQRSQEQFSLQPSSFISTLGTGASSAGSRSINPSNPTEKSPTVQGRSVSANARMPGRAISPSSRTASEERSSTDQGNRLPLTSYSMGASIQRRSTNLEHMLSVDAFGDSQNPADLDEYLQEALNTSKTVHKHEFFKTITPDHVTLIFLIKAYVNSVYNQQSQTHKLTIVPADSLFQRIIETFAITSQNLDQQRVRLTLTQTDSQNQQIQVLFNIDTIGPACIIKNLVINNTNKDHVDLYESRMITLMQRSGFQEEIRQVEGDSNKEEVVLISLSSGDNCVTVITKSVENKSRTSSPYSLTTREGNSKGNIKAIDYKKTRDHLYQSYKAFIDSLRGDEYLVIVVQSGRSDIDSYSHSQKMIAAYFQEQNHKINEWIKPHNIKLSESQLVYDLVNHIRRYRISLSQLDEELDRFRSRQAATLNDSIAFFNQSIFTYERALKHYNTVIKYLKYESNFLIDTTGYSTEELALLKEINPPPASLESFS